MEEGRVELEGGVRVGDYDLFAIAQTVRRPAVRAHGMTVALTREAIGVVVRGPSGVTALMADGRLLSIEQLLAEHPSLVDAVSAL